MMCILCELHNWVHDNTVSSLGFLGHVMVHWYTAEICIGNIRMISTSIIGGGSVAGLNPEAVVAESVFGSGLMSLKSMIPCIAMTIRFPKNLTPITILSWIVMGRTYKTECQNGLGLIEYGLRQIQKLEWQTILVTHRHHSRGWCCGCVGIWSCGANLILHGAFTAPMATLAANPTVGIQNTVL